MIYTHLVTMNIIIVKSTTATHINKIPAAPAPASKSMPILGGVVLISRQKQ